MAKLKHPKRFWPKFSEQRSARNLTKKVSHLQEIEGAQNTRNRLTTSRSATFGFFDQIKNRVIHHVQVFDSTTSRDIGGSSNQDYLLNKQGTLQQL